MEWVVTNAKQYHLDLRNLFFVGDSAGAHLATAYTAIQLNSDYAKEFPKITVSPKFVPKALVLNCGVFDMEGEVEHRGVLLTPFLTDILGEKPTGSSIKKMSPVGYITPDFPPVYLATSNGDFLRKHSHRLKEVLEQKQIDFVFRCKNPAAVLRKRDVTYAVGNWEEAGRKISLRLRPPLLFPFLRPPGSRRPRRRCR